MPQIREILAATGDYDWEGAGGNEYDEQLAIAMKRFQKRHGLEAIGNDRQADDRWRSTSRPASAPARSCSIWNAGAGCRRELGEYHFLVNIAAFELQRVQANVIVERMDVVAGAVATQTPEFSDELEYIEFNPTWTVPYSIATKEMLPKLKRNAIRLFRRVRSVPGRHAYLMGRHRLERLGAGQVSLHLPPKAGAQKRAGQGEVHAAEQAQHLSPRHAVQGQVRRRPRAPSAMAASACRSPCRSPTRCRRVGGLAEGADRRARSPAARPRARRSSARSLSTSSTPPPSRATRRASSSALMSMAATASSTTRCSASRRAEAIPAATKLRRQRLLARADMDDAGSVVIERLLAAWRGHRRPSRYARPAAPKDLRPGREVRVPQVGAGNARPGTRAPGGAGWCRRCRCRRG